MGNLSTVDSDGKGRKPALFPELEVSQCMEQGEVQKALQVAISALKDGRRNPDLSNLAGVCAATLGDGELASQLWQHAIEISPNYAQAWFNLGLWHEQQQHVAEAIEHYAQAISFDLNNVDTMMQLACLLISEKRTQEAVTWLRKVLALQPEHAQAHNNLGLVLAGERRFTEAEQHYWHALASAPDDMSARINLGLVFAATGREGDAEKQYLEALEREPGNAKAMSNYGLLLDAMKRPQEAELQHRKAAAAEPASIEILSNLANSLSAQRREAEAEVLFHQALGMAPDSAVTHTNLGVLLTNLKREGEAEHCFRRALEIEPEYLLPKLNLSYLQLSQGRFVEGWSNYEVRYSPRLPDNGIPLPPTNAPQWHGEDINGKSLLVWAEQGYGDQIQFTRYIPLIKQRWNAHIILVCRVALVSLFASLDGVDVLLGGGAGQQLPENVDYWVLPLSMPLIFKTFDVETIPATIPYLTADQHRIAYWQEMMSHSGLKVGLVWRGNPKHNNDQWRSLNDPELLMPLLELPEIHFYTLQTGESAHAPPCFTNQAVTHLEHAIKDFADTAAIITQLDLIICVDTAVAHLAGALGKPCWVMLPYYRTDWRWLQHRSDTPWYPNVLRLFRQHSDENWELVIQRVKNELQAKTAV